MSHKGSLAVITGPMFSNKTDDLISRAVREEIARRRVIAFRSVEDTRDPGPYIKSRTGAKYPATVVNDAASILEEVDRLFFYGTVCVDESQFFGHDLIAVVDELIACGLKVIVSGLNTDFYGKPYSPMPNLMATADHGVTIRTAICTICGEEATRSQLLVPPPKEGNKVVDNGKNGEKEQMFEARCRGCHRPPPVAK